MDVKVITFEIESVNYTLEHVYFQLLKVTVCKICFNSFLPTAYKIETKIKIEKSWPLLIAAAQPRKSKT